MNTFQFLLCFLPVLIACSGADSGGSPGQSGVASGTSIAQLTDQEASQLCDWSLKTEGGAGNVTKCGDGSERETHTKDQCLEGLRSIRTLALPCTITVGDAEGCSLETQKDACAETMPACDRISSCVEQAKEK
jgi:hypothetical protein